MGDFLPLERGLLSLMRVRGALQGLVLVGAAMLGEVRVAGPPPGTFLVPALLALSYLLLWAPGRRFRAWGYRLEGDALHVRRGLWVRVETIVPLDRVEHIDLSQGPLERAFGISRLILHTAGTLHSQILVPGLARETAERMRDEIRARLPEEEA
jgi:hypothetical protein